MPASDDLSRRRPRAPDLVETGARRRRFGREQMQQLERVGVVGCGLMGSGIAEVIARAGVDVMVREIDAAAAERGRARIESSLERAARSGKLDHDAVSAALGRIGYTTDLEELADRQLVIEAIAEDESLKAEMFRILDEVVEDRDAIFASNTSSIPIMKLGIATSRPERVIGIHFFNPVPVLNLVEIVPSLLTSDDTIAAAERLGQDVLGKTVIRSQDRAGFVVNALLIPYLLSAIRMMESGFASADDIDSGMVNGCGHPMGPLRLTDLIGLDTTMAVAESLYAEFKEPLYAPPPLLARMVDAGLLGRKTGRGFYDYRR
jgi:3-hydroxybutyryl-CoA dehydrogenase